MNSLKNMVGKRVLSYPSLAKDEVLLVKEYSGLGTVFFDKIDSNGKVYGNFHANVRSIPESIIWFNFDMLNPAIQLGFVSRDKCTFDNVLYNPKCYKMPLETEGVDLIQMEYNDIEDKSGAGITYYVLYTGKGFTEDGIVYIERYQDGYLRDCKIMYFPEKDAFSLTSVPGYDVMVLIEDGEINIVSK